MIGGKVELGSLTGTQKAAVFLLNMGEEYASAVFSQMTDDEIKRVASVMAHIEHIAPDVLAAVSKEFLEKFEGDNGLLIHGENFFKSVVDKSLDAEKAREILNDVEAEKQDVPFGWSRHVQISTLAQYVVGEHPQTVAMILAHLPAEISAEVMMAIPEEKKGDIALRVVQLGQVPEDVIREVDTALRSGLSLLGSSGSKAGGLKVLVDILNEVDKTTEDAVMEAIEEEHDEMANDIRNMMFVFEDLASVDDRAMREILKKVEGNQLTYALKTASEEMKQKIFGNLSSRASEMLNEDLEVMGPVRLSEVEEAQQAIVRAAKELEAEGTIMLGGKGKEDVFV